MLTFPFGLGFGIAAVIMGRMDLQAMRQNQMDFSGFGQTKAGLSCGILGIVLSCLSIIIMIAQVLVAFA